MEGWFFFTPLFATKAQWPREMSFRSLALQYSGVKFTSHEKFRPIVCRGMSLKSMKKGWGVTPLTLN